MLKRPLVFAALSLLSLAALTSACEKSNDIVVQEQLRESQQEGCPRGCEQPKEGCAIKGNISGAGLHWYFEPGNREYGNVLVDAFKGEAWFCTPAEAEANGFNPLPEDF